MSQEKVELARAFLAAFLELMRASSSASNWKSSSRRMGSRPSRASWTSKPRSAAWNEFLEFRAAWMEPYDDFSYEPVKIINAGGYLVVVTLHQRGKPHGSDSWVEMDYGLVYTVEEGLITKCDFYATPEQALEAAGLRE